MTSQAIACPGWCVLGDGCEGYHQSAPVAAPLPMTTGQEFGDALVVTVGHLEAEDFPPEIVVSPWGDIQGGGDSLSLRIDEVRTLIAALDDALFVLGEVTELTRARQRVADLEAKAEEAKDAWLQACDDAGHFALQVEEMEKQVEKTAALERRLDLIQTMARGWLHHPEEPDGAYETPGAVLRDCGVIMLHLAVGREFPGWPAPEGEESP